MSIFHDADDVGITPFLFGGFQSHESDCKNPIHGLLARMKRRRNYVTGKCLLLGFLFVFAWFDLKKRELPLLLLGICGAVGALIFRMTDTLAWQDLLGGLCVGGGMLLFALVSKESIGMGDGLLFCVTGIYLGVWQNLLLLFGAVLFCAAAGAVLLIRKKCTRKQQLPFAPFVLAADVALLFFLS